MFRKTIRDLLKQIQEYECHVIDYNPDYHLILFKLLRICKPEWIQIHCNKCCAYFGCIENNSPLRFCALFCGSSPIDSNVCRRCIIKTNNCVWTLQIVFLSNIIKIIAGHCDYYGQMRNILFTRKCELQKLRWLCWWKSSRRGTYGFVPLNWLCGVTLRTRYFS